MRNEFKKNTLRKILALLLVLTLVFGSSYSSYAKKDDTNPPTGNTKIHLDVKNFTELKTLAIFVYLSGHHGTVSPGIEHVLVDGIPATKLTMTTSGNSGLFTAPDLGLIADPIILHFEIGGLKYVIGRHIIDISQAEGNGSMNYEVSCIPSLYNVSYDANGATSGNVPVDSKNYYTLDQVIVLGNVGNPILERTGFTFQGWSLVKDNFVPLNTGDTFNMGTSNVTLYALWLANEATKYTVTYNSNDSTAGTAPTDNTQYFPSDLVTVKSDGDLVKTNHTFGGWNTQSNGQGNTYQFGNTFAMSSANVTLYAKWTAVQQPTNPPTTETPTTPPPTTETPTNPSTVPTTEGETEVLTNEPIPLGPSTPFNIDEPLASSTFEEVVEIEPEEIPLADALPQTGQLPVEIFYGIGGLITAVGVFLKKK